MICRNSFAVRVIPDVAAVLLRKKHHGQVAFRVKRQNRAEGSALPSFGKRNGPVLESVGIQRVVELILHPLDLSGDFHRLKAVIFQYLIDGGLGDDALVAQLVRAALSGDGGRHLKNGILEDLLILRFPLPGLFVE